MEKNGCNLIYDRARKRNEFNTELTSKASLHWDSSLKTAMKSNL